MNAVAFIKENKPKGTVVYDDLANQLATVYFGCRSYGKIDPKVEDAGISVVDENGDPSEHSEKDEKSGKGPSRRLICANRC